jgi:hypothetical protein
MFIDRSWQHYRPLMLRGKSVPAQCRGGASSPAWRR